MDIPQWVGAVVNLGLGGTMALAVIWFLRYLLTDTLPKLQTQFLGELREERQARQAQHLDNRADHAAMIQLITQSIERVVTRLEKVEETLAEQIKDTRHALVNLDGAVTTVLEIQNRERQKERQRRQQQEGQQK